MLRASDVPNASKLITRRGQVAAAKWDAVIVTPQKVRRGYADPPPECNEKFDAELAAAVEKFRVRRLAQIDAKVRELGVDVVSESD